MRCLTYFETTEVIFFFQHFSFPVYKPIQQSIISFSSPYAVTKTQVQREHKTEGLYKFIFIAQMP